MIINKQNMSYMSLYYKYQEYSDQQTKYIVICRCSITYKYQTYNCTRMLAFVPARGPHWNELIKQSKIQKANSQFHTI